MPDTDSNSGGKAAAAYRTIGEVAAELNVPQHVLRFWETKFPQIKPMKRAGGRRYYRPEDVEILRRVESLLHREGYTIKGAQRLLADADASDAGARDSRGELSALLDELTAIKALVDAA